MRKWVSLFCFLVFVGVFTISFSFAAPSGVSTITPIANETAPEDAAESHAAYAGNVTEITLQGFTTTQTWQGYFGNVSGAIELADSSGNAMYNWSLASPKGEVYASTASSLTWGSIACFDMTTQLAALETAFNVDATDADRVNATFNLNDHAEFYTGTTQFTAGVCNNTKLFNDAGVGTFDEVLLSDGANTIFASLLQEDVTGFNAVTHDFEMIVLEDGHDGDTDVTTYNFWVELE